MRKRENHISSFRRVPGGILISAMVALFAIAIAGPVLCRGEEPLPRTIENSDHGFSISLPADWSAMTLQRLNEVNEVARQTLPGSKSPLFHYGYEMTTRTPEMTFSPRVLIRVMDSPNGPDPAAVRTDFEMHDLAPGMETTKAVFNPELDAWMIQCRMRITNAPPVDAFLAYYLTKTSVIKIFIYTPHDTDHHFASLAQQIIRSVRISDQNKIVHDKPASPAALVTALVAIVVMVLVLAWPRRAKLT